jgi:hypothetical protein
MHTGSLEELTLPEVKLAEEEVPQEMPAVEQDAEEPTDLPECPNHQPASFLKGKPRYISQFL